MPESIYIPPEDQESAVVQRFYSKERPEPPPTTSGVTYLPASRSTFDRVVEHVRERPPERHTTLLLAFDSAHQEKADRPAVFMPPFHPRAPIETLKGITEVPQQFHQSRYGRRHELWIDDIHQRVGLFQRSTKHFYVFDDTIYNRSIDYLKLATGRKVPAYTVVDIIATALLSTVRA